MLDLLHGRTDTVEPLARLAEDALVGLDLPDGFLVRRLHARVRRLPVR